MALLLALLLVNRRQHLWLLEALLPRKVIRALRMGRSYAETYECATVLFSDIVQVRVRGLSAAVCCAVLGFGV